MAFFQFCPGVSTNLTTYAIFAGQTYPYVYSNLSLAFRLPWRIVLMPQAQYAYTRNMFLTAKVKLEKPLFRPGLSECFL